VDAVRAVEAEPAAGPVFPSGLIPLIISDLARPTPLTLKVEADITLENYDGTADCVVLPGGMPGSKNLQNSKKVAEVVRKMNGEGKWVTAICAAPALALASAGVLEGKRATCYPGFESNFAPSTKFSAESVVVDGNVVTSRGPGTAMQFALELVEKLAGRETAQGLRQGMLVN